MKSFRLCLVGLVAFALLSACSSSAPTASKPTVQIVAPAFGAEFNQGDTVRVESTAADPNGVTRIELYVDGQLANTKLAASAQGETQFNGVQEWVAANLGAHTMLVRAFNTANATGEASITVAVNPRIAGQPTASPTEPGVILTATPLDVSPTPAPVTVPANDTPVPPTDAPPTDAPTAVPPTAVPPTATRRATLPPVVFQPPFDGGMSVSVDWSENGLEIEAQANDTKVGQENGDGIAYMEFFIQQLNGAVIASKRENTKPYCFFSEEDGECVGPRQSAADFKWSDGRPIKAGWYFVRAVAHTPDNRIQVAEQPLHITFPPNDFQNLFVNIIEPGTDRPEKELVFQAEVNGTGAESGIDHVDMFVVTYDGKIVHSRTESNPNYCGFGGGDNNTPCPSYNFAEHGLKWTNSAPVNPTQYVLRAVAYTRDGQIVATTFIIQIDKVK